MAAVIDLTELSSDEEDVKGKVPQLVPMHGAGSVLKKFTVGDGRNGGHGEGSVPSVMSHPGNGSGVDRGQPHSRSLLNSGTKGKSAGVRRATKVGKIENTSAEEVSISPRFSNWGDPLPPEPASHSPHDHRPGETGTHSTGGPSRGFNGNASDDVQARERRTPFAAGKGSSPSSPPPTAVSPGNSGVCRHFWRAGDYEAQRTGIKPIRGAMDHVRVHPKFLHSNATSHKWALGAVAELLDNAVDEIQNGATFVSVDKIINPRDKSPALLIQDDGGGMSPDILRQCMSLGYSGKNTNTTIGQYGNGFKTSTMRLGADVIVFSRCSQGATVTQSIGLLSYTFLRKTGLEDVVVPMIDYEVSSEGMRHGEPPRMIIRSTVEDWRSNLASIMQWSPYSSEIELLAQFENLGWHGTKVIVYNLWFNDDGVLELDFHADEQDIQLRGGVKLDKQKPVQQQLAQNHIANQYHHSLRVYTSILYLQMPPGFQIILRGKPVEHHSIAADLKFSEHIIYKPLIGNRKDPTKETSVITVIGFTKEAPLINVHGFNVYHKNRLIMPFWKVWQDNSSRGRGVVGVLEANFVEPAHDKQDFERTAVLLRLEGRLKQMTVEYWNTHCHMIGYQPHSKAGKARKQATAPLDYPSPVASITAADVPSNSYGSPSLPAEDTVGEESIAPGGPRATAAGTEGPRVKAEPVDAPHNSDRSDPLDNVVEALQRYKRQRLASNAPLNLATSRETGGTSDDALVVQPSQNDAMMIELIQENSQLRSKCAEYEHDVTKLTSKVLKLEKELREVKMKNGSLHGLQENGLRKASKELADASDSEE